MNVKLDENLGRRGAAVLRAAGHNVTTAAEEGLSSAGDRKLAEVCRSERKCLVTLDLDFGNPLRFVPSHYAGIAVLRLPRSPAAGDLIDAVRTLAAGLAGRTVEGRLWIVQRGHIREYREEPEDG